MGPANRMKTIIVALSIIEASSGALAAEVHYNGPVDAGTADTPIHIPSGYTATVHCSGPAGETCVLVHSEPMKAPVPCDKPPFGDPPELYLAGEYGGLQWAANNMAAALKGPSLALTLTQAHAEMRKTLSKACDAKYHGAARDAFYGAGILDQDFDTKTVFALAAQFITMAIARSPQGREEQAEINARLAATSPQPYSILACVKGDDCRPFSTLDPDVFKSAKDCEDYRRGRLTDTANVHFHCVPAH